MSKAVVLLSGGMDSSTVLALALSQGFRCFALGFDYGQRHRSELIAAKKVSEILGAEEYRVMRIPIGTLGGSALTDEGIKLPRQEEEGIPVTYVPARNTVFLSISLAWAEILGAETIFIGVNAVDYSGYPDCRPEFVDAFQALAKLATKGAVEGRPVRIEAPLVRMTKVEIIQAGVALGVDYSLTVSCYQADELGRACGYCDACKLRRVGFVKAGVDDPTRYQST